MDRKILSQAFKSCLLLVALAVVAAAQTIPAGTPITVRSGSALSSGTAKVGERFAGTLARDLVVAGNTVARQGAPVKGKVTYVKPSGRLHAPGELTLRLTSVEVDGKSVPLQTAGVHIKGKGHTKGNAEKIGGGAAAGALIGGLVGGGKGALIGAGAGGAAGTGVAAATGKEEATVTAEEAITFRTSGSAGAARRRKAK
jgi:hypothetical protein